MQSAALLPSSHFQTHGCVFLKVALSKMKEKEIKPITTLHRCWTAQQKFRNPHCPNPIHDFLDFNSIIKISQFTRTSDSRLLNTAEEGQGEADARRMSEAGNRSDWSAWM